MQKPLEGVRVADFSRLLPGAYCTWLLATLGAQVIKIEQPGKGDYQRDFGVQAGERGGAVFQLVNQGKRSIALDLKSPATGPVLNKLVAASDIIVESFRPGVASRLGLDFEKLRTMHPAIVCVSISGFGSNSPLRSVAAHDINYLAYSGALARQIGNDGAIPEIPYVDLIGGGLIPALSAMSLLFRAKLTGIGGAADLALADGVPLLPNETLAAAMLGRPSPRPEDAEFSGGAPNYAIYELRDGFVSVGAVEEQFWTEFCRLMQVRDGADGKTPLGRKALKQEIAGRFRMMTRSEVESRFRNADACVTIVNSYGDMLASEQAQARRYTGAPPSPGAMPRLGGPFFHDGRREFADGAAPLIGEHGSEIMKELGFEAVEIESLAAQGALQLPPRRAEANGATA